MLLTEREDGKSEETSRRSPAELDALADGFLSVVSHEFQTPLSIIKGYASTLARTDTHWSPEVIREGLAAIEEEAERLSQLVNDVLTVSRIQALGLTAKPIPVDLPSLVERVVRRLEAADPRHRFATAFPRPFPTVLADHEKIEIVVRNLLDNAIKYAPPGSTITVTGSADEAAGVARISVRDEGPGIPEAARERVFERFYRVDTSNAREAPGTGLGLYICRAIVAAHAGQIWVEEGLDRGTTVTFTLPLPENVKE